MNFAGIARQRETGFPSLDEVIAEPSALGEVMPELFLFCLAQAFQVKLQLNAERTHRSMSGTGFLAVLLD